MDKKTWRSVSTRYGKPSRTPAQNNFRDICRHRSFVTKIGPKVMPAVNPDHNKDAVKEYGHGECTVASVHATTNSTCRSASYTKAERTCYKGLILFIYEQ